jgi:hypothetical protein
MKTTDFWAVSTSETSVNYYQTTRRDIPRQSSSSGYLIHKNVQRTNQSSDFYCTFGFIFRIGLRELLEVPWRNESRPIFWRY